MTAKKKHPLEDPVDSEHTQGTVTTQILRSTIGLHPFKLTFIDSETHAPLGYGWFEPEIAANILGAGPIPEPDDGTAPKKAGAKKSSAKKKK